MVKYSHWCLIFNKSYLLQPAKFSNMLQIQQPTFQVGLALNLVFNAYISLLLLKDKCACIVFCVQARTKCLVLQPAPIIFYSFFSAVFFFCTNCNFLTCSIYLIAVLSLLECKFHKYSDQCFIHKCILEQGLALSIIQYIFV